MIPGLDIRNGQAGQAAYVNFTTSYKITKGVAPGLNGFFYKQLNQDRTNGVRLSETRQEQFYIGPGIHFDMGKGNLLDLNAYFPVEVRNTTRGPQFNLHLIHVF